MGRPQVTFAEFASVAGADVRANGNNPLESVSQSGEYTSHDPCPDHQETEGATPNSWGAGCKARVKTTNVDRSAAELAGEKKDRTN